MPYIEHYEKVLAEEGIAYDVCYFDRNSNNPVVIEKTDHGCTYTFSGKTNANPLSKIIPAFSYMFFVKKTIKSAAYDKIIVFTTMPAVLLSGFLIKNYRKNYIYDYRDYTYEKYRWFARRVEKAMSNSAFTAFSSEGYLESFSTLDNYLITHNITNMNSVIDTVSDLRTKETISIGFLGYVRYFEQNVNLINSFANNEKYILKYFGTRFSDCDLETYCRENGIFNVDFQGEFDNADKPKLYRKVDIINSIYSLDSPEVKQAIPNRLYDSAMYKKPIIVSSNTQLAKIVKEYGLGLEVNPLGDDVFARVQSYIDSFDPKEFEANCNKFLTVVKQDLANHEDKIRAFLRDESR